MSTTPSFSSDPIPGPDIPDGYAELEPGAPVLEGDRFLSAAGTWKLSRMEPGDTSSYELRYSRPDPFERISERSDRIRASAARVPSLLLQIANLEARIRDQETTISKLEADYDSLREARRDNERRLEEVDTEFTNLKSHLCPGTCPP